MEPGCDLSKRVSTGPSGYPPLSLVTFWPACSGSLQLGVASGRQQWELRVKGDRGQGICRWLLPAVGQWLQPGPSHSHSSKLWLGALLGTHAISQFPPTPPFLEITTRWKQVLCALWWSGEGNSRLRSGDRHLRRDLSAKERASHARMTAVGGRAIR